MQASRQTLRRLGLKTDRIYEAIICTWGADGRPNAAPMGIKPLRGSRIAIRPFTDTATHRNMLRLGCATVNFSSDPLLYYRSAFKHVKKESLRGMFKRSSAVNSPDLRCADAVLAVSVDRVVGEDKDRTRFECEIVSATASKPKRPEPYSRAPHALIECVIHATRVEPYARSSLEEARRLLSLIEYHRSVIKRTAPRSRYEKAADEIYEYCRRRLAGFEAAHKDAE